MSGIESWVELRGDPPRFVKAVTRIKPVDIKEIVGFDTIEPIINGFEREKLISSEEAQAARDHLKSIQLRK
jgi:hypothetical protein